VQTEGRISRTGWHNREHDRACREGIRQRRKGEERLQEKKEEGQRRTNRQPGWSHGEERTPGLMPWYCSGQGHFMRSVGVRVPEGTEIREGLKCAHASPMVLLLKLFRSGRNSTASMPNDPPRHHGHRTRRSSPPYICGPGRQAPLCCHLIHPGACCTCRHFPAETTCHGGEHQAHTACCACVVPWALRVCIRHPIFLVD
jgi:hypothetical protein